MNTGTPPSKRMRIAVLASGTGTNFSAILDAVESNQLDADIALCMSNKMDAGVLEKAHAALVPTVVLKPADFDTEDDYSARFISVLESYEVNFIALAGYLRRIPSEIVTRYRNRIANIHPALLPAFGGKGMYGRRVHEAVLQYGVRWTGATVHLVDEEYDTGPIVLQEPVPVHQDDSVESLAKRVLEVEHRLYPLALQLFATDRVRISGRRVMFEPSLPESQQHTDDQTTP